MLSIDLNGYHHRKTFSTLASTSKQSVITAYKTNWCSCYIPVLYRIAIRFKQT